MKFIVNGDTHLVIRMTHPHTHMPAVQTGCAGLHAPSLRSAVEILRCPDDQAVIVGVVLTIQVQGLADLALGPEVSGDGLPQVALRAQQVKVADDVETHLNRIGWCVG